MKILYILLFFLQLAQSDSLLAKKGSKIAHILCDEKRLETLSFTDKTDIKNKISQSNICQKLTDSELNALIAFINTKQNPQDLPASIIVPEDAKCQICGMYVSKFPKWTTMIEKSSGKKLYFDGVKDMMKYYHSHRNEKFDLILVNDFYTLKPIDAKKAFFVSGSNVYGPMGKELIAFKAKKDAKTFLKDHRGKKILTFDEISPKDLY